MATGTADEVLATLIEGNRRFAGGMRDIRALASAGNRESLVAAQSPKAIVLGCSDSRVPAEIVFDQGLGDLFVIRVAGNIIAPSLVGSVEFAASEFGTRLVMVLGHSGCGAVQATVKQMRNGTEAASPGLASIVSRIRPVVATALETLPEADHDELVGHCVRANIRTSAQQLRTGSAILERLIAQDGLRVVGAEYDLETGLVDVFDGMGPA